MECSTIASTIARQSYTVVFFPSPGLFFSYSPSLSDPATPSEKRARHDPLLHQTYCSVKLSYTRGHPPTPDRAAASPVFLDKAEAAHVSLLSWVGVVAAADVKMCEEKKRP